MLMIALRLSVGKQIGVIYPTLDTGFQEKFLILLLPHPDIEVSKRVLLTSIRLSTFCGLNVANVYIQNL
jgi:hypothetical protein